MGTAALILFVMELLSATGIAVEGSDVLMMTLGGTRSHTFHLVTLGRALVSRGHNVTLVSGYPGATKHSGVKEVLFSSLVAAAEEHLQWDLLSSRFRGIEPVSLLDAVKFYINTCTALHYDEDFLHFLKMKSHFDMVMIDTVFADCIVGLSHYYQAPLMLINPAGLYRESITLAGNPESLSTMPFFSMPHTDRMTLPQRVLNAGAILTIRSLLAILVPLMAQPLARKTFGEDIPNIRKLHSNAALVLQIGDPAVTYSQPLLPNVIEVGCIQCRDPKPLPKELEDWVYGAGPAGCVLIGMGTSFQESSMPPELLRLFLGAIARLPQRFIWKWDRNGTGEFPESLPPNVITKSWFPQQDLLGHPGVVALVSHGGLNSMFEAVYHAKPLVAMPVFGDHAANAAKAQQDGYGLLLDLHGLTAEKLAAAISSVIRNPRYRVMARLHSRWLRDQPLTPLKKAVYWTEFVLRHRGAPHLQGSSRNMSSIQSMYLDFWALVILVLVMLRTVYRRLQRQPLPTKLKKQ